MNEFDEFDIFSDRFFKEEDDIHSQENDVSKGLEELISQVNSIDDFPLLFSYVSQTPEITKEKFFNYILHNFDKINEKEFDILNKNFFVRDYIQHMFEYVLDNHVLISQEKFIQFLHQDKKHFNHFKKDYQQQLITYYAFNHFDSINDYQWKLIFEPVYEYDYRHLFANIDFKPQKSVLNKTFWSFFTPQSNIVKSYLDYITTNKLHNSMSFMCEHFEDYINHYLYDNVAKQEPSDNTILEQHYIYHNPQHCTISKLNYQQLYQVFARIYHKIPDKDLTSTSNKEFYNDLENGSYYLFDYISQNKPEDIRHLFEKRPKVVQHFLNDLNNFSYKSLNIEFQKTFFEHVLSENIDLLFQHNDIVKNIIVGNGEIQTPIQQFLKEHIELLPSEDKQHLIFKTIQSNVVKFNMPLLIEQLMNFSTESLQKFAENINIYLNIINDSHECKTQFEEIKQSVNKSIINKKLTHKFNQDIPNKVKRIKI